VGIIEGSMLRSKDKCINSTTESAYESCKIVRAAALLFCFLGGVAGGVAFENSRYGEYGIV